MTSRRSVMRIALYGDVPERTLKELARRVATVTLTTFLGVAPLILEQDLQARFLIPMAASLGFGITAGVAPLHPAHESSPSPTPPPRPAPPAARRPNPAEWRESAPSRAPSPP